MSNRERTKGRKGEAEVRAIFEAQGFDVRALEGRGDHVIARHTGRSALPFNARLHSEVKRTERAQPWEWIAQAEREAPPGAVPVVSFRRSRSPWYSIIRTEDLARLLA